MITYEIDEEPAVNGVYACRVASGIADGMLEDKFLMYYNGRWTYTGSDQGYRGLVPGWIGPLQRRFVY